MSDFISVIQKILWVKFWRDITFILSDWHNVFCCILSIRKSFFCHWIFWSIMKVWISNRLNFDVFCFSNLCVVYQITCLLLMNLILMICFHSECVLNVLMLIVDFGLLLENGNRFSMKFVVCLLLLFNCLLLMNLILTICFHSDCVLNVLMLIVDCFLRIEIDSQWN